MNSVRTLEDLQSTIEKSKLSIIYISRPDCSVCHGLLPQIEKVLVEDFPQVVSLHVNADEIPEIAGVYSIFTVPVVIVFVEGKEMFRKARFVPIEEFRSQLSRLVTFMEDE
ncbi:thioredoxin-like negative regulator of GroEL [Oikeobacillus pervagus]|uniref:Thioredoxin-like negative regulator of GroEL n=1 Tax=Oikeobacillus pervagus TaxID=1325931 RepID=A0AAJ1WFV6_9BACI|nr:thioredoxin family protein [Oikeobacillus pervagus]MDQ0214382.1 thioredoxin-like negative regulator of GroEL [Oikeobacillus pervagus]